MSDPDPATLAKAITEASQLPVDDAAYALWSERRTLDRCETVPKQPTSSGAVNLADPEHFAREVRRAMARIQFEADNPERGPTFSRLKAAHPNVADEELRRAIRSAVRLERESTRLFSYSNTRTFGEDVRAAIELAQKENPDFRFSDATYRRLELRMMFEFR